MLFKQVISYSVLVAGTFTFACACSEFVAIFFYSDDTFMTKSNFWMNVSDKPFVEKSYLYGEISFHNISTGETISQ